MSQATFESIKKTKLKLKKSLGQNFLTQENIVRDIVACGNVDKETTVVEIGPGIGALTGVLIEKANQVIAIEIDQRLIPILNEKFGDKITLKNEDFLMVDIYNLKNIIVNNKVKVIANLPYYITTPIINKIMMEMPYIDEVIIMVQKEVAERICATPKSKKYNSLSVFCQTVSDVKYEFTVGKENFNPVPKVDSAIISLKRRNVDVDIKGFEFFVQNCFKQKRKTLLNNLFNAYNFNKDEIEIFLIENELTKNSRSEEISNDKFKDLFDKFIKYQKK